MSFGWGQIAFKASSSYVRTTSKLLIRYVPQSTGHIINAMEVVAILLATYQKQIRYIPPLGRLSEHYDVMHDGLQVYISPVFMLGLCLSVLGAGIRASCYRHMGRHFTFELTIQRNHKLITTGPYALVRHPSYTGMFIFSAGSLLCLFGSGSYWNASRMWGCLVGWMLGGFYVAYRVYVNAVLFARVAKEDEVLRKEFKEEWEQWIQQTPYRLIPLCY